jgi:hypothetical protein
VVPVHSINPLNAELNSICHFLAFVGAHHILHVSRVRVKAYGEWRYRSLSSSLSSSSSSSSLLARQPLVGPGLLKKLCPFVSVKSDLLPVLDL